MAIEINGEMIDVTEAQNLLRMLYDDAYRMAGEFHTMERSEKFRINWPDEYKFADANWKSFVDATRQLYTARLADPLTSEHDKHRIFLAIVLERKIAEGQETDNRLQLRPNTQQFVGDKHENRKIKEKFTNRPNMRAALLNSVATRH